MDACCICCQKFQHRIDKIVIIKHSNDDTLTISRKRGHYFHHSCIQEWRSEHGTCPLDRDPISKLYKVPEYQIIGLELGLYNYDYDCVLKSIKVNDALLDQFTSINEVDKNNRTLPFYACKFGNYALVSKLLKRCGDFNIACGCDGFTPLMTAICHYHVKIVLKLLSNKTVQAKVNVYDSSGFTAFSYACELEQLSIIREFIIRKLVTPHQVKYSLDLHRSKYAGNKGKEIIDLMCHYLKTDQ
jgi:ankyrin repeat protein